MKQATFQLGHAHLKVRDLERAVEFYTRFFGLSVTERLDGQYVFLSGNSMHHQLALQKISEDAKGPDPASVGLYHLAFEVPDRESLIEAYRALRRADIPVRAIDHGISQALYFDDPDGNGLEIYRDTRQEPGGVQRWQGNSRPLAETDLS